MRKIEEDLLRDLEKEFDKDFKTKIFFKLFKEQIVKVYKLGITYGFNSK